MSRSAPLIVHDQVDRSEWIRVQLAVDADRRRCVPAGAHSALHRASSDPSLVSAADDSDGEIDWTAVSPELDALCHRRKATWSRTEQRTFTQHTVLPRPIAGVGLSPAFVYLSVFCARYGISKPLQLGSINLL